VLAIGSGRALRQGLVAAPVDPETVSP
jgi:hypothetical protein